MLYEALKRIINKYGLSTDLINKINIFFANNQLTQEEYKDLMNLK